MKEIIEEMKNKCFGQPKGRKYTILGLKNVENLRILQTKIQEYFRLPESLRTFCTYAQAIKSVSGAYLVFPN